MFTETKILKKLIKNAYKGSGLHVEHTDKGWLAISGWWWRLEIGYLELSNEIKAQLVECIGEIPEPGEAYLYIKGTDPQSEIPGTTYINLLEKWTQCQTQYSITNVVLRTADDFVECCREDQDARLFRDGVLIWSDPRQMMMNV